MSGDGERDDARPPFMPTPVPASPEAGAPPKIPRPRFQSRPSPAGRKPLPRHIVKQILDAGAGRRQWVDPVRLEMEARRRATKPEREGAFAPPRHGGAAERRRTRRTAERRTPARRSCA